VIFGIFIRSSRFLILSFSPHAWTLAHAGNLTQQLCLAVNKIFIEPGFYICKTSTPEPQIMAPSSSKRRKVEDGIRGKTSRPTKRRRKQLEYHSSSDETSEDDPAPTRSESTGHDQSRQERDGEGEEVQNGTATPETGVSSDSDEEAMSQNGGDSNGEEGGMASKKRKPTSKRSDPDAFATSISKILSTKLAQGVRADPVLSRSADAAKASSGLAQEKLERRAQAKAKVDRREELERGRVKDVLGLDSGMAGSVAEEEKQLRKIAQRGVVKLFNAVRAAQVKGEEAARDARKKGIVGYANREEKVNEMSKQGFLDLINGPGKGATAGG
jgi:hypothetical protein